MESTQSTICLCELGVVDKEDSRKTAGAINAGPPKIKASTCGGAADGKNSPLKSRGVCRTITVVHNIQGVQSMLFAKGLPSELHHDLLTRVGDRQRHPGFIKVHADSRAGEGRTGGIMSSV